MSIGCFMLLTYHFRTERQELCRSQIPTVIISMCNEQRLLLYRSPSNIPQLLGQISYLLVSLLPPALISPIRCSQQRIPKHVAD